MEILKDSFTEMLQHNDSTIISQILNFSTFVHKVLAIHLCVPIMCMGTQPCFFAIFAKGNNFCDSLFANVLNDEALPIHRDLNNVDLGKRIPSRVDTNLRRKAN